MSDEGITRLARGADGELIPAAGGAHPVGTGRSPLARLALFYRQVVVELRKVVYPSRDQLLRYTAVVLVFVIIMITIVSLLDYGLSALVLRVFT